MTAPARETVVLLHGLALGAWAMTRLQWALARDGFRTVNVSHPSRTLPLEQLADEWLPSLLQAHRADEAPRLHFVTHSMGGIILRAALRRGIPRNLGRVVMIAPPNQGTALVDRIGGWWAFRAFTGVNGCRLGTQTGAICPTLGSWPAGVPLGIIAGNRTLNPLFSAWIGEPNDGKVAVAGTRLAGMTDHLVLPHSHTWLQYRADVIAQVRAFLRHGRFDRDRVNY